MEMSWPIVVFFVTVVILKSVDRFVDKLFEGQ